MIQRYTLSKQQLEKYFDRICLPPAKRVFDTTSLNDQEKVEFLHLLVKHQLVKIPWENLAQHYSFHRTVNVKPAYLYRKIIEQPGRGGYCFEANHLSHVLLYSLHFDAYMAGTRVYRNAETGYGGFSHLVNIVTIGGTRYMLDGGFGPQAPPFPFPLEPGLVVSQVGTAESRLRFDTIPNNLTAQKLWILEFRSHGNETFRPLYAWPDVEWSLPDIICANLQPATDPHTFFTHKIVAVRFTTAGESLDAPGTPSEDALESDIDGTLVLNQDKLKWRRNSEKKVEIAFKTEAERVDALRKYFGIELDEEEQEAILGTAGMISGQFSSEL